MDQLYKYFRWLSLDIVLGAIFFLAYLEDYYEVALSWHIYYALASAIWLIYTVDHLIDARSVENPSNDRHRFHQTYFRQLAFVAGIILIFALGNVHFLPLVIIQNGALLSTGCVGYLMLVYFFKSLWIKEVLVAMVYAGGVFLAPISLASEIIPNDFWLFAQLVLVAFLNLIIFSFYDFRNDQRDGFNSLVIRLGIHNSKIFIYAIGLGGLIVAGLFLVTVGHSVYSLFFSMTLSLILIFAAPQFFAINDRFRIAGDGVFYLAAIFLLF